MLAFTRTEGEGVVIGEGTDCVRVHVVRIEKNRVRLSIDAPREVRVDRSEVRARREAVNATDEG